MVGGVWDEEGGGILEDIGVQLSSQRGGQDLLHHTKREKRKREKRRERRRENEQNGSVRFYTDSFEDKNPEK